MKRIKTLFLLLSTMLMLSTCASPAYAFSDENAEQEPAAPTQALTPEGNMALVDDIDGDAAKDKQFIVVQSRGGHYFYIIIDHASEGENIVHFLNQVDEADLLSLIEQEEQAPAVCSCTDKCHAGAVNTSCEICAVNMSECAGTEPEPEPEKPDTPPDEPDAPEEPDTPEKKAGNPLMIVALLAVLGAGGAVAYLKFFKKKPSVKGSADLDDYDYGADDDLDDDLDTDLEDEPEEDSQDDEPEEE